MSGARLSVVGVAPGICDPRLPPSRQLVPVRTLAGWLAPALEPYVRHDGSSRSQSRTTGWLLRETARGPFRRVEYDDVFFFVGDTVANAADDLFQSWGLHLKLLDWDDRKRKARWNEEGRPERDVIAEVDREAASDATYLDYRAVEGASSKFMRGSPYARQVMQCLRDRPELRLAPDDRADDADEAAAWLRSLPRGFVPRPELYRRYEEAGSPGGLGKYRLLSVAADLFGPPSARRHAGKSVRGFVVRLTS